MGILFLILVSSSYLAASLVSDDEGLSKGAAAYLSMSVGARALGMGNAFVAISDDSSAVYWNPAGLSQVSRQEVMAMSGILGIDRSYHYLDYVFPIKWKVKSEEIEEDVLSLLKRDGSQKPRLYHAGLAIGWINFGIDNIEGRDDYGKPSGDFSDREDTFIVAYGHEFTTQFSLGGSYKYHLQKLEKEKAEGFSFDIGAIYKPTQKLALGLSVQNIGGHLRWTIGDEKVENDILMNIRVGGAYKLKNKMLVALDIEKTAKQNTRIHLGSEYQALKNVFLRVGSDNFDPTMGCSLVLPLRITTLQIDYALLMDLQENLNWINRFSLRILF